METKASISCMVSPLPTPATARVWRSEALLPAAYLRRPRQRGHPHQLRGGLHHVPHPPRHLRNRWDEQLQINTVILPIVFSGFLIIAGVGMFCCCIQMSWLGMFIDTYRLCRYFAKYAAVAEYREKYEQITRFKKKFKNYVNVKLLSAPNFPNKFLFSRKFEQFKENLNNIFTSSIYSFAQLI